MTGSASLPAVRRRRRPSRVGFRPVGTPPPLCLLALALALAAPTAAATHAFRFWQGPPDMIIPMDDIRSFFSTLTNIGELEDSYTLTVTRQQPASWLFSVCYDFDCGESDQTVYQIPLFGTLAPNESLDFEFEIMSFDAEGEGHYTIHLVSNSNNAVQQTRSFTAKTPVEPYALLLSAGEDLMSAPLFSIAQFKPMLYNAGTEPDTYLLTIERNTPENWMVTYCFDYVCYPHTQTQSIIPDGGGYVWGGDQVPLEIDFTTLFDEGIGSATITIASNTNPALMSQATFTVTTGSLAAVGHAPPPLLSKVAAAPNPFNPRTEIRFELGGDSVREVVVEIFDARGRQVRRLSAALPPGRHQLGWDGRDQAGSPAAAGSYLARITAGGTQQAFKLSLVK